MSMYDEIKTVPLKRTFGRLRLPEMTHQSGAAAVAVECVCADAVRQRYSSPITTFAPDVSSTSPARRRRYVHRELEESGPISHRWMQKRTLRPEARLTKNPLR